MKKRLISILTVFIFILNFIPVVGAATLQEVYYSNLRIALKSMSSTSTKITFNSDYLVKLYQGSGETKVNVSNGTSYSLTVENNKIKYLDKQYDCIEIISLNENGTLSLQTGNTTRKYMGDFKIVISSSKILPINIIDVERYLTGVVGYEIWPSSPIEALKAQTLAARTYALNNYKGTSSQFDLNDDETSQVYKGVYEGDYKTNILKAVNDTKGEVLTYNNSLIAAYFSASNGGYTELSGNVWSTNLPYLDTKEDSFDTSYTWTRSFTAQEIETRMISNGKLKNGHKFIKIDLTSIKKFQSGRLETINLELYKTLTKEELLKVLSTDGNIVDITLNQNIYQFKLNNGNIIEKQITDINSELKKQSIIFSQDTALRLDLASIKKAQDGSIEGINLYYSKALNKTDVRTFLNINGDSKNLLSSLYTISFNQSNNTYTFSGNGYGHGVGMSQYGAKYRANAGQTYKQILAFYYPNTTVQNLNTLIKNISIGNKESIVNQPVKIQVDSYINNALFEFVIKKDGTEVLRQEYSNSNLVEFTPKEIGNYRVVVNVKESLEQENPVIIKTVTFKSYQSPTISKINLPQTTIYRNKSMSIKVDSINGTTIGKQYEFEFIKGGKSVYKKIQDSPTLNYTPTEIGEYIVRVKLKDKTSKNNYDDMKEAKFNVYNEPIKLNINRTLKRGMKGTDVKILQEALIKLKYLKYSKPNSVYDTNTFNAVKTFQKANKLKADGIFGLGTKKALEAKLNSQYNVAISVPQVKSANVIYLKVGSRGNDVLKLQNRLRQLGYLKQSSCTGYFGTITQNALKAYQKANKLPQTGVLDTATYNKIYK